MRQTAVMRFSQQRSGTARTPGADEGEHRGIDFAVSEAMMTRTLIACACTAALAACAVTPAESPEYAARMTQAGDRYTACITGEAEKSMKNPARAEDIAIAAHGRCWSQWEAYRTATNVNFTYGARTPEEKQYARDKSDAHLRQFELESRRSLTDWVVQHNMPGAKP